jgi:hypothetical protein
MYESTYCFCNENGGQVIKTEALFEGQATD